MSSWSQKRQLIYFLVVLAVVLLLVALPTFLLVYKAPTCSDGKQNQGEAGIDCGGPCVRLCSNQALDPVVLWQRPLKVASGLYNVVAYLENPNISSGALNVPYRIKIYDAANLLLGERKGLAYIPPHKTFAIFEGGFETGDRVPARASFEFLTPPIWLAGFASEPTLQISNKSLETVSGTPKLTATLINPTTSLLPRVEVVAIVYSSDDNALAASRTVLSDVAKDSQTQLVFTWPEAFSGVGTKIELISRLLPR